MHTQPVLICYSMLKQTNAVNSPLSLYISTVFIRNVYYSDELNHTKVDFIEIKMIVETIYNYHKK